MTVDMEHERHRHHHYPALEQSPVTFWFHWFDIMLSFQCNREVEEEEGVGRIKEMERKGSEG